MYGGEWLETGFVLVSEQGVSADIVIGPHSTGVERHAARELASYVERMTGARMRTLAEPDPSVRSAVLIGRPETNPTIADLATRGKLRISRDFPGLDGFVIKTVEDAGKTYLVLGGSADRSSLYAVYDFLERYCHVGFFWDCERVPKAESLIFDPIDFSSRPHFENRQNLQACVVGYSAAYWPWEEWKREIDWMAKKKFNILHVCMGGQVVEYETMKAMGVETQEPPALGKAQAEMAKKIVDYAHSLGLRIVSPPATNGHVPQAFRDCYPDARYFEMQWFDYPTGLFLYPDDPMFVRMLAEWLRQTDRLFGTDHLYNIDAYAEMEPDARPEDRAQIKAAFGRAVSEAVRSVAPDGKWIMSGWGFVERDFWPVEHIEAMLEAIPDDILILNDLTSNYTTNAGITKVYRDADYFYGKRWGWSVFHCFGGNTQLHGDVSGLIRDTQDIVADPRAANCRSFYLTPEIVRHNAFYFDLAAQLGWDPRGITLAGYIRDYAQRRYGAESAPRMADCLEELTGSVYSWYDMNDYHGPIYQFSATTQNRPWYDKRVSFIPSLKKALDIALGQSEKQQGNACYERDLVDISKEYLGNLVTKAAQDLVSAQRTNDRTGLDDAAKRIRAGMSAIEQIAAVLPEYHLADEIARATRPPYNLNKEDATVDIRIRYSVLVDFDHYDTLLDYARRDMYELIKYYYRPRMEFLISYLDDCLRSGREPSEQELHDRCKDIAREFVYRSPMDEMPEGPMRPVAGRIRQAVEMAG